MPECYFCHFSMVSGYVDIGGLALCLVCYDTRRKRKVIPCEVCRKSTPIGPDPLVTAQICSDCDAAADLVGAYQRAYKEKAPCDRCGGVEQYHHATVYGQNICHACYEKMGGTCTQVYPGDRGYPAFERKPSIPALVLPYLGSGVPDRCEVCKKTVIDPYLRVGHGLGPMPALCEECRGPKWWAYKDAHREELPDPDKLYTWLKMPKRPSGSDVFGPDPEPDHVVGRKE